MPHSAVQKHGRQPLQRADALINLILAVDEVLLGQGAGAIRGRVQHDAFQLVRADIRHVRAIPLVPELMQR